MIPMPKAWLTDLRSMSPRFHGWSDVLSPSVREKILLRMMLFEKFMAIKIWKKIHIFGIIWPFDIDSKKRISGKFCFSLIFSRLHPVAFRRLRIVALIAALVMPLQPVLRCWRRGRFCWFKQIYALKHLGRENVWDLFPSATFVVKRCFYFRYLSAIFFSTCEPNLQCHSNRKDSKTFADAYVAKSIDAILETGHLKVCHALRWKGEPLVFGHALRVGFLTKVFFVSLKYGENTSWIVESTGIDIPRIDEIDGPFSKLRNPH